MKSLPILLSLSLLLLTAGTGLADTWVQIATDRPVYGENDTMTVYLSLENTEAAIDVDLYIAVEVLGQY